MNLLQKEPEKLINITYSIEKVSNRWIEDSVNRFRTLFHVFECRMNVNQPSKFTKRLIGSYDSYYTAKSAVESFTSFQKLSKTHMIVDNDWISNPLVQRLIKASTWVWECNEGTDPDEHAKAFNELEDVLNEIEIVKSIKQAQQ